MSWFLQIFLLQSLVLEAESELEDFPKHHLTVSKGTTWPCIHVGTRASYRGAAAGPFGNSNFYGAINRDSNLGPAFFFSRSTFTNQKIHHLVGRLFGDDPSKSCVFGWMFCWGRLQNIPGKSEVITSMPMPYVRRRENYRCYQDFDRRIKEINTRSLEMDPVEVDWTMHLVHDCPWSFWMFMIDYAFCLAHAHLFTISELFIHQAAMSALDWSAAKEDWERLLAEQGRWSSLKAVRSVGSQRTGYSRWKMA